jgi:uncharacterized membrane protein YkgB
MKELLSNIFKTKTTTLNIMIVMLGGTFCFGYVITTLFFLSDSPHVPIDFVLTKEALMKDILLIGFGALVKTGYDNYTRKE